MPTLVYLGFDVWGARIYRLFFLFFFVCFCFVVFFLTRILWPHFNWNVAVAVVWHFFHFVFLTAFLRFHFKEWRRNYWFTVVPLQSSTQGFRFIMFCLCVSNSKRDWLMLFHPQATLEMKGVKEMKALLDILELDSSVYVRIQVRSTTISQGILKMYMEFLLTRLYDSWRFVAICKQGNRSPFKFSRQELRAMYVNH